MGSPKENGSPDAIPVEVTLAEIGRSSRRDWLAFLAGLLQLPLTFFVCLPLNPSIPAQVSISVFLFVLAGGTGIYVGTRFDWATLPRNHGLAIATRLGATTGLIVFLVGGGMAIVAVTLYLLRHGVASDTQLWREVSVVHSNAVLFSLIPTVVAGSLGCLMRASTKLPPAEFSPAPIPSAEEKPAKQRRRRAVILCAVLVFILSLFSPAIPQTTTPPPEPVATDSPNPADGEAPTETVPIVPPPPPFNYERPPGLEKAHASEWTIEDRHTIEDLDPSGPVAVSQDNRFLAYTPTGQRAMLTMLDLRRQTVVRHYRSLPRILATAWSPNSEQIFCVCDSPDSPYWIIDTSDSRCMSLPVWSPLATSNCIPVWRDEHQIHLVTSQNPSVRVLDLETLALKPASSSAPTLSAHPLPETPTCRMSVVPRIHTYQPPPPGDNGRGLLKAHFAVALVDKQTKHAFRLRSAPSVNGTRFVSTPDSSILVAIGNSSATVYYMGLKTADSGNVTLTADLPDLTEAESDSELQSLLKSSQLGTFVCAPLINPLNDRVIGPNRVAIRGIARILSWEGVSARLVMADTYQTIDEGCVLAGLHYWKDGQPVLVDSESLRDWWTPVNEVAFSAPTKSPGAFPRWDEPEFQVGPAGFAYRGHHGLFAGDGSLRLTTTNLAVLGNVEETKSPTVLDRRFSPKFPFKKTSDDISRRIEAFVRAHHDKVNRGDVQGYANDYHHIVDYYDHGPVSRNDIHREQADYLPKYLRLSETVVGKVQAKRTAENTYLVTYQMHSLATRLDGSRSDKLIQITVTIGTAGNRLVIHREKSKILEDKG